MNAVIKDNPARVAPPDWVDEAEREYFDDLPEMTRRRMIVAHLLKQEDLAGVFGDILLDLNPERVLSMFSVGDKCAEGTHLDDLIYNAVSRQIRKERGEQ